MPMVLYNLYVSAIVLHTDLDTLCRKKSSSWCDVSPLRMSGKDCSWPYFAGRKEYRVCRANMIEIGAGCLWASLESVFFTTAFGCALWLPSNFIEIRVLAVLNHSQPLRIPSQGRLTRDASTTALLRLSPLSGLKDRLNVSGRS